jgi:DNA-directed RNA polymerase subunit omega
VFFYPVFPVSINSFNKFTIVRDDYLKLAQEKVTDPNILINMVSRRAKQLKSGEKPLIESLERLSAEDLALREIIEDKLSYQLFGE